MDALERRCPFLIQHSDVSKHVWGIRVKNTVVGLVNQMQIAPRRTQAARWPDSVEKQECRKLAPDSCRAPLVSVDLPSTPAWGFHPRPHNAIALFVFRLAAVIWVQDGILFRKLSCLLGEFVCCEGF